MGRQRVLSQKDGVACAHDRTKLIAMPTNTYLEADAESLYPFKAVECLVWAKNDSPIQR